MLLVLMLVILFWCESTFQPRSSKRKRKFSSNQICEKQKIFMLISDILFLAAFIFELIFSGVEPLLLILLVNTDEIISMEGMVAALDSLEFGIAFNVTPLDLSLTLVVFLEYFKVAVIAGMLCACAVFIESQAAYQRRVIYPPWTIKSSKINSKSKIFLRLCHLLN